MEKSIRGKISSLPHHIREQVHSRLRDGELGTHIVLWLNSLAEVRQALAAASDGRPITGPNLSEWKKRHHPAWLLQQAALAQSAHFLAQSSRLAQAGQGNVSDHLAAFLATRYALATRQLAGQMDERQHFKLLRALSHDVAGLRRGDHRAEHLRLERQRLEQRQLINPSAASHDSH
ncbi:MAG: hypothetical protein ABSG04_02450 [Verrucomicrobiota bacterium]